MNLKAKIFLFLVLFSGFSFFLSRLSAGDRYFHRLQNWYSLAKKGDWDSAKKLEASIDSADIIVYKLVNDPSILKKYINNLVVKPNKSVEDWLEISRIQNILGKKTDAIQSLSQAQKLDPVRDDIGQIFYSLSR